MQIYFCFLCIFTFGFCGILLLAFGVHKGRKGNKYKWSWLCHFFPAVGKAEILTYTVSCAVCYVSEGDLYFHIDGKMTWNEFGYTCGNLLVFQTDFMSVTINKVELVFCECAIYTSNTKKII